MAELEHLQNSRWGASGMQWSVPKQGGQGDKTGEPRLFDPHGDLIHVLDPPEEVYACYDRMVPEHSALQLAAYEAPLLYTDHSAHADSSTTDGTFSCTTSVPDI